MIYVRYSNETEGFKLWSTKVHGLITLPLSCFGVIFNILTIAIFSQKTMRSVTNNILLGISVFDILLMTAYTPYAIYFYLLGSPDPVPGQYPFWPYYALINSNLSLFAHGCSVWFTCFLALYRYLTVTSCVTRGSYNPIFNASRVRNTMIGIILMMLFCMTFNVLSYSIYESCFPFIEKADNTSDKIYEKCPANETSNNDDSTSLFSTYHNESSIHSNFDSKIVMLKLLWVADSQLSHNYPIIPNINFWIHAIVFRTVPCLLLLVLSALLIYVMRIANMNRLKLMQQGRRSEYERAGEFNRTTTMLLIVVISFLIMELPHGILYIICSINSKFFREVYVNLGDLLDLLVLINSSINFFLYCCMSSQFRDKFKQMFCSICLDRNSLNKQSKIVATSNINLKRLSRAESLFRKKESSKSNSNNSQNRYLYVLFNYKKKKQHSMLIDCEAQNLNSQQIASKEPSTYNEKCFKKSSDCLNVNGGLYGENKPFLGDKITNAETKS